MNKQELINELAKYVKRYENATDDYSQGRYGAYKVSLKLAKRLNEQNITDKQAWDKVAEAYPESAQSLRNTLDNAVFGKTGEPQKHVMPKFFDKWAKQVLEKRNKFYAISLITRAGWGYGVDYELGESENPSTTRELLDWLVEDSLYLKEKATEALLYGYEVEEEPLYRVKIGEGYFVEYQERGALIIPDGNKEIKIFDSKSDAERTAQTIGGTVEEVAEG
ncbi:DUF1642 domain-containing protein [Enterococcus faecium]|uniref:DUF1642 domain-containing protein n=1 Tax=Enterococcus faecium TaxID=1352 RepID=UPI001EDF1938|nr:DUF1642 domain-containing protein [Enterococcus faecium]MCG4569507.1 DUF1642 domain-containing protein [Enterococcus faecium]